MVGPSGWLVPALQEGCYIHKMNEGFFTPLHGLCGLWHQGGRATTVKDKDQTGQASQGQAATGPGDKLSRDPQSLRAGPVGGVGGQAGWGGPGRAQAPQPCMQVRPVCGQRGPQLLQQTPRQPPVPRVLLGTGERCAKGP